MPFCRIDYPKKSSSPIFSEITSEACGFLAMTISVSGSLKAYILTDYPKSSPFNLHKYTLNGKIL
ncbi:MAG: hypothetical protein IJM09_07220 [Neisseriaceae bacterium]|nr:hypothetical protein [Neisseriaceae bacterium]